MLNLSCFLTRAARVRGKAPAIFHGDAISHYAALDERVSRLAAALTGLGVSRQDRIGIVCDSEPRGLECMIAPLRAGMVLVPMNPKLHPAEHAYMLQNCGAAALICGRPYRDGLAALREQMPAGMHFVAMDEGTRGSAEGIHDYDRLLSSASTDFSDVEVEGDDLAWIFYTSGTTGRPKGAMLTQRNLLTMIETQLVEINPVAAGDRLAYVAPISHSAGLMAFQNAFGKHEAQEYLDANPGYSQISADFKAGLALDWEFSSDLQFEESFPRDSVWGIPVRHEGELFLLVGVVSEKKSEGKFEIRTFLNIENDTLSDPKLISHFQKAIKRTLKNVIVAGTEGREKWIASNRILGSELGIPWVFGVSRNDGLEFVGEETVAARNSGFSGLISSFESVQNLTSLKGTVIETSVSDLAAQIEDSHSENT